MIFLTLVVGLAAALGTAARLGSVPHGARTGTLPALYVVALPGRRTLQWYLDPGLPGFNGIHATFFDAAGRELEISGPVAVHVVGRSGAPVTLPVLREGPGHFYTDFTFGPGLWRLEIVAKAPGGEVLRPRLVVRL